MPAKKAKSVADQFKDAKARVEKLPSRPSNDQLLDLYGLYKQATEGDVSGSRPGLFDLKGPSEVRRVGEAEGRLEGRRDEEIRRPRGRARRRDGLTAP